jgi:HAD superfamily hydrolase (TIGR01509 family)
MLSAALFDLDGTLLDSNDVHVRAWHAALVAHGYNVAPDRIGVEVGKGGDKLVPDLLGREAEAKDGDALRAAHDREFGELASKEGLLAMPGAKELLARMRRNGLKLALATSSNTKMLEICERTSGIAWRELFDEVALADDVNQSKPAPDIVTAAVHKLGVSAAECVMFGDTPWDARAAKHAGVVLVGVLCGGNDATTLVRAGSRVVYRDPAAIAERLEDVLHRASPGALRLDRRALETLMQHALDAAAEGLEDGEAPIGAVLARGDGEVVARGWNRFVRNRDRSAHAELEAFRAAAGKLDPTARDTILVSTLEPCVMCLGAAMEIAVDTVVYGLRAPEDSGTGRVQPPESADNQMPRIVGQIRAEASRALFEQWLARPGHNPLQDPFVRALLAASPS